jgi:hypothetical protein
MKRTKFIILFAILTILLILLSCTMPIYIVTSPTNTDDDSTDKDADTSTPTLTYTPTETSTPTYQVTPTVSVSLDGPWTIWQGTSQQMLDINFLQDGFDITANVATEDDQSLLYEGVISHDGKTVTGTWESTNGTTGSFVMYLDSNFGTFSGNMGGGVPFCGNRTSTAKPATCLQ